MPSMRNILFLGLFNFLTVLHSQPLTGIYTIGGFNPDFSTIGSAVQALNDSGINGNVIFNIRPGFYTEQVQVAITNYNSSDTVIFQSETLDSSDVEITYSNSLFPNNYVFYILDGPVFCFNYLTISNYAVDYSICINAKLADLKFHQCQFFGGSNPGFYWKDRSHIYSWLSDALTVTNCRFINNVGAIHSSNIKLIGNSEFNNQQYMSVIGSGLNPLIIENHFTPLTAQGYNNIIDADSLWLLKNQIENGFDIKGDYLLADSNTFNPVYPSGYLQSAKVKLNNNNISNITISSPRIILSNNKAITGMNSVAHLMGKRISLINNKIDSIDVDAHVFCYADSNEIYKFRINMDSLVHLENCSIHDLNILGETSIINNCKIDYLNLVNKQYGSVSNSVINSSYFTSFSNSDSLLIENNYLTSIDLFSCNDYTIRNNRISTLQVGVSGHHNNFVYNNTIDNFLDLFVLEKIYVFHNNINASTGIHIDHVNKAVFKNNNLNVAPLHWYSTIISDYNNYFPGSGPPEIHSISVDPLYKSSTNLIATNPLLMGRGANLIQKVPFDINYLNRKKFPTIGANELCIDPLDGLTDSIHVSCGDEITLNLCTDSSSNYNYLFQPGTGLNDSTIPNPRIHVYADQVYAVFVYDSLTLVAVDTIVILADTFHVDAGLNDSIDYCGKQIFLNASWNAKANYVWQPGAGLSDSLNRCTLVNPYSTTTYVVTATIPGCGTSTDSVIIGVYYLPVPWVFLDSVNHNYFLFLNASTCADSFYWNFGDSTFSNDVNPWHIYQDTGWFQVTLIACNNFGCDTFVGYVYVDYVLTGMADDTLAPDNSLMIFPNPNNGEFSLKTPFVRNENVQIEVYTSLGQKVYHTKAIINTSLYQIKIPDAKSGLYVLEICSDKNIIAGKFSIK